VILIDTSVWVEVFRKASPLRLEDHVNLDDTVTCLPVIQEVLQGFRDEAAYLRAYAAMFAFPVIESPLGRPVFEDAARLYRAARRAGFTARSSIDCLIAACALRHDVEVLHRDRDFPGLARVSGLRQRKLRRGA
jgi:predicted nucleic acid-binding protein